MYNFVLKHLKQDKKIVLVILFSGLIYSLLLGGTGLTVAKQNSKDWSSLSLSFLAVIAFRFLLDLSQWHFANALYVKLKVRVFDLLEENLPVLRSRFSNVELMERMSMDVPNLIDNLIIASIEFLTCVFSLIFVCGTILYLNPEHLFMGVGVGTIFILGVFGLRKVSQNIHHLLQISEENIFRFEKNYVEGYDYLKTSERIEPFKKSFAVTLKQHLAHETKKMFFDNTTSGFIWGARFAFILLLVTPAFEKVGVSSVVAFWIFLLINIFQQMAFCLLRLNAVKPAWDRAAPIFSSIRGMDRRSVGENLEIHAKELEIYFDQNHKIRGIGPLEFLWKKGDRIWIKGPSGKGKTTLMRTLTGLHDFYKGQIEIPNPKKFKLSFVEQEPFFFDGESIGFNLGIGTREELDTAFLDTLYLREFFESINFDLDKKLGRVGVWPSKGQRIRLALLRELIQNPDLLLVDEPTSGLDEELARTVLLLLSEISKEKIVVICEHNPLVEELFNPNQTLELNQKVKKELSHLEQEI